MRKNSAILDKRQKIARHINEKFDSVPGVQVVYVLGSVASGWADEQSDVDITIVCSDSIIDLSTRESILSDIGEDWTFQDPELDNPIWAQCDSDGIVDGILVSVHYQTSSFIQHILNEVLDHGAITTEQCPFRPYTLVGLLQRAWILRDDEKIFSTWLVRSERFPHVLKVNILNHFIPILRENVVELVSNAERNMGPSNFLFFLTRAVDALISILYALNEVFDPADRRAEQTVWPELRNVPSNFMVRLNSVLEGPFNTSTRIEQAHEFSLLTDETLEIASSLKE